MANPRIAAIVVTYNRILLLQECIRALQGQSRRLDEIVVINNGSTDNTGEWLASQPGIIVITQPNAGSSGGQFCGLQYAVANNFDWAWCMDDDTIPEPGALGALVNSRYFIPSTAYLCSVVLWKDGALHNMNRPLLSKEVHEEAFHKGSPSSKVIYSSFVSVLINAAAVKVAGYPLKKMFIWYDDLEYTIRLGKYGPGYLIEDSIVYHKTEKNVGPDFLPRNRPMNAKELLGLRNYLFVRKSIFPFNKRKLIHIYLYMRSVASFFKYGIATRQTGKVMRSVFSGLRMNNKQ